MDLLWERYVEQTTRWPQSGRHILAQFDEASVVVYQAYRPAIGHFAIQNRFLGGDHFSLSRMSWIKPNFLWMMYRCGWGTKDGQEVVLAVRIRRTAFDGILRQAVHTTFVPEVYSVRAEWMERGEQSEVRLQWDPDHDPYGAKLERRAIQLGLRGATLRSYAKDWIVSIEDISDYVRTQQDVLKKEGLERLMTPREEVYPVSDPEVQRRLGVGLP